MCTSSNRQAPIIGVIVLILGMSVSAASAGSGYRGPFGFGSVPSADEIRVVDIAVEPDGEGLPAGQGTIAEGAEVYKAQCAKCHGPTGTEGPRPRLVGSELPVKTIGTYWPYATTLFDYIRRAMPIPKPGSLTDQEVYALTAWLLHMNDVIGTKEVMNAETLPQVRMPNREGLVPDPRPDVR